jgi:hypothetical protein
MTGLNRKQQEEEDREELVRDLTRMGWKGVNAMSQISLADTVCKLLGLQKPQRPDTEDREGHN